MKRQSRWSPWTLRVMRPHPTVKNRNPPSYTIPGLKAAFQPSRLERIAVALEKVADELENMAGRCGHA